MHRTRSEDPLSECLPLTPVTLNRRTQLVWNLHPTRGPLPVLELVPLEETDSHSESSKNRLLLVVHCEVVDPLDSPCDVVGVVTQR